MGCALRTMMIYLCGKLPCKFNCSMNEMPFCGMCINGKNADKTLNLCRGFPSILHNQI